MRLIVVEIVLAISLVGCKNPNHGQIPPRPTVPPPAMEVKL
jgi:hypothetical protein